MNPTIIPGEICCQESLSPSISPVDSLTAPNEFVLYALSANAGQQIFCKATVNGMEREILIDPGAGCSLLEGTGELNITKLDKNY